MKNLWTRLDNTICGREDSSTWLYTEQQNIDTNKDNATDRDTKKVTMVLFCKRENTCLFEVAYTKIQ